MSSIHGKLPLWAVMLFALMLKLILVFTATPNWDASYYLNIASNYLLRGELTPYMWRLGADTTIIAGSGTGYGVFILIGWVAQFGLTILSGRILMYLAGLFTLAVLYRVAKLLWKDRQASQWVVIFTSLNVMFFYAFVLRMDALGILAYSLVLWLHIYASQSQRRWLHALVGILTILTVEVHIIGTVYVGAYAFYYAFDQIRLWYKERRLWVSNGAIEFYIGAFIAGCVYLWVHVLPDPRAYFIIAETCNICIPRGLDKEISRFLEYLVQAPLETIAFGVAVTWLARSGSSSNRHILILLVGALLSYFVVSPPINFQYSAHLYPLASLIIGGYLSHHTDGATRLGQVLWLLFTSLLVLIGLGILPTLSYLIGILVFVGAAILNQWCE